MTSVQPWETLLASLFLAAVMFSFIPETSSVSYPLQRQGLLPAGKKVGESLHPYIKSTPQRKKSPRRIQNRRPAQGNHLKNDYEELPMYKKELVGNELISSPPSKSEREGDEKRVPYYDCPLFFNGLGLLGDGNAIIKADPENCSCCYYCNWGIHYVQCCPWPLLWKDDIKSCDWYINVTCYTYDGWDE